MTKSIPDIAIDEIEAQIVDPPNPYSGALLAWIFPGAGHLYQGRTAKGLLFMGCLVPLFLYGMILGGGKVAFASPKPLYPPAGFIVDRWQFVCQSGIGAVALPAMVQRERFNLHQGPLLTQWFYPPSSSNIDTNGNKFTSEDLSGNLVEHASQLDQWASELGFLFELGGVVTAIAGLLNLLVVYDALSGPMIVEDPRKKKKQQASNRDNQSTEDPSS